MTSTAGQVTSQMVNRLWLEAIAGETSTASINERAEFLLSRVSAESPVTNWGLTRLHAMTCHPPDPLEELSAARTEWIAEVGRYEADPAAWMRRYFLDMLSDFRERHGLAKTKSFAAKLVKSGEIPAVDLPANLKPWRGLEHASSRSTGLTRS